jgi:predicted transcriptional regulator
MWGITEIALKTNLPVDRANTVLHAMTHYGLVLTHSEGRRKEYTITSKGYEFMSLYERILALFPHKL